MSKLIAKSKETIIVSNDVIKTINQMPVVQLFVKLKEAVEIEDYIQAAAIRDEIQKRSTKAYLYEVVGNKMNCGTFKSIIDGDIITADTISPKNWLQYFNSDANVVLELSNGDCQICECAGFNNSDGMLTIYYRGTQQFEFISIADIMRACVVSYIQREACVKAA